MPKVATTLICSDIHAPYQNDHAVASFVEAIREEKPARVVVLGDTFDCYQLSSFDKDPARLVTLQDDLDAGIDVLATIRRAAPKAELFVVEGNHEARLRRYLTSHPELSSLKCFSPGSFFGIDRLGSNTKWVGYQRQLVLDDMLYVHGHLVRKRAGMTAQGMMDAYGRSGMSGHVHRLGLVYRTQNGRTISWAETGCLCALKPEYMHDGVADWQNGFARVTGDRIEIIRL